MNNTERDQKFEETIDYLKSKQAHCSANYYEWHEFEISLPHGIIEIRMHRLKSGQGYKDCQAILRFPWMADRCDLPNRIEIGKPTKEPSPAYVDEVVEIATGIHNKVMEPINAVATMLADWINTAKFVK